MSKEANFDFSDLFGDTPKLIQSDAPIDTGKSKENQTAQTKESGTKDENDIEFIKVGEGSNIELETQDDEDNDDEVTTEDENNTPSSDDTKGASGSFALAFAKFQQEEGVISECNAEELNKVIEAEGEVGALRYLLELQRDAIFEEAKSTYAADQQELKEYFDLKDSGVDIETARELAFNKKQFTSITDEKLEADENLRKSILVQHYKATTSFSDAKINKLVEQTFNLGEDLDEAKEAVKELKKINDQQIAEAKKQVELREKANVEKAKAYQEDFKKFVYEKDEFFKGMKINKQTKDKIIDMVFKPAVTDNNGNTLNAIWAERAKDPRAFDAYLAAHLLNGTFYGDLGKIKTKAKTSAVTELEKQLEGKTKTGTGKTITSNTDSSIIEQFLRGK